MEHNVMLVEGNRLMLEKLSSVVKRTEGFNLVVRYQDVSDALGQGGMFHPDLILLDTEQSGALQTLSEFRRAFPGTAILCLGEHWQAETASRLVQEGAIGYLIKPFTSEELKSALETFGKSGMEVDSQVLTFFSPKGKSGKTTLIANIAVALSRRTNEQIGVIDADLQFGDMALLFNLEPQTTIVEAVRDVDFLSPISLSNYFLPANEQIHVLCGTLNPSLSDKIEIHQFEEVVRMAQSLFRYVLIDVPSGFCPISISASELSNITYIIAMESQGYTIRHVQRAIDIFKDWEDYLQRVRTIFTRVSPCDDMMKRELENLLNYPVDAIIPNEFLAVSKAADEGYSMLDIDPHEVFTKNINLIVDHIIRPYQQKMPERVAYDDFDEELM